MSASRRTAWVGAAVLVGVAYFVIGRVFALPANNVRAWRLAAWLASAVVYAAHVWHEHFRRGESPRGMALHAAVAVAIGAFALAVAGMVHSLSTAAGFRPVWLVALVAWPAFTALPAFLFTLAAGTVLARLLPSAGGR